MVDVGGVLLVLAEEEEKVPLRDKTEVEIKADRLAGLKMEEVATGEEEQEEEKMEGETERKAEEEVEKAGTDGVKVEEVVLKDEVEEGRLLLHLLLLLLVVAAVGVGFISSCSGWWCWWKVVSANKPEKGENQSIKGVTETKSLKRKSINRGVTETTSLKTGEINQSRGLRRQKA